MEIGFENIVCPVCNESRQIKLLNTFDRFDKSKQMSFKIVECVKCSFTFLNPRPKIEYISNYYQVDGYDPFLTADSKKGIRNQVYLLLRNLNLYQKYSKLTKIHSTPGKLLDIGCATGEFIEKMSENSWKCKGVEISQDARKYSEEKGFDVFSSVDEVPETEQFDMITMWHVLEHVHDLKKTIQKIHNLLKPGGLLIIAVPNIESSDFKQYGAHWIALDTPRHLYHFSGESINNLLKQDNFTLTESWTLFLDQFYNQLMSRNLKYKNIQGWGKLIFGTLKGLILTYIFDKKNASSRVYCFQKGD